MDIMTCKFEVFGKVQKVYFRKHTEAEAQRLGLRGWCQNTDHGTVIGELEGPTAALQDMKTWLQTKGSPHSRIDRVDFRDERCIGEYSHEAFGIVR